MAPLLGPRFQEATSWWAMSGKAIQDAVPPARTDIREMTRRFESEGHVASGCGLFRTVERSTCCAKDHSLCDWDHVRRKIRKSNGLYTLAKDLTLANPAGKTISKCRRMHIRCSLLPRADEKGLWRLPQAPSESFCGSSCCPQRCAACPAGSDTAAKDR